MTLMVGVLLVVAFCLMVLLVLPVLLICLIVRSQYQTFCEWKRRGYPGDLALDGNLFALFSGRPVR